MTHYISHGQDLEGMAGCRIRVQEDGKRLYLEEGLHVLGYGEDNSIRLAIADTGRMEPQKKVSGLWQPDSFQASPETMWLGKNVGLAAAGHHIVTEDALGHFHFHTHSDFDGELSITDAHVIYAYYNAVRAIAQADDSGDWQGTEFGWTDSVLIHSMIRKGYWKTGPVAATQPIRIRVYEGEDANGDLLFDREYPASDFPANSEVETINPGYFEVEAGVSIYIRLTSDATFSLKMNAAESHPWAASDASLVRYDNLLQTADWVDGATYTEGDWFVDNRKIYVCNTTGAQTGSFAENISKWDELVDKGYVDLHINRSSKTGIISGGDLSIASATTINIAAGTGVIIDTTDASNIIRTEVSWDEVLGYSPNLSLDGSNIILINSSGTESDLRNVDKTDETYRDYIILGTISIYMSMIIHADSRPYNLGYDAQSFEDFERDIIGPATINGLVYSANGANLSLDYTGGRIYDIGCGFAIGDQNAPNEKDISPATTPVLFMTYHDGPTLYPDGGPTIFVNPDKIDNGDGTTSPVGNNNWTVQRIFYSPTATLVSYGQEEYNTFDLALEALTSQDFFEAGALPASWFRAYLIIKQGAIDLSDTTQAVFYKAPKFRIFGAGGGIAVGVSVHPSLSQLEWDVAGHLFEDAGVFDIGNYSFSMPGIFGIDTAGSLTLNDGTRDRILSNPSYSAAYGPNGIYYLMVANGQISLNDNHGPRVEADSTDTILSSPWDGSVIVLRDSGITITGDLILNDDLLVAGTIDTTAIHLNLDDNSVWKFQQDDSEEDPTLRLRQTVGTTPFYIDTDDSTEFRDALGVGTVVSINHSTGYIQSEGLISAHGGLRGGKGNTADGDLLLQLAAYRTWEFRAEGDAGATDLRLRCVDGTNTKFFIDTDGITAWRNKAGSHTVMELNHSTGVLKVDNKIIFSATSGLIKSYDELGYFSFGSNAGLYWQDVNNNTARFSITSDASYLVAPGAEKYIAVTDNGVEVKSVDSHSILIIDAPLTGTVYDSMIKFRSNEVDKWIISSDHSNDTLYLFEGTSGLRLFISPTEFSYSDAIERLKMDVNDSRLISPDGSKSIFVKDDKIYIGDGVYPSSLEISGDLEVAGYINSESNIVAQGKLQAVSTGDGETLLQFETPRRWVFQQEGAGSAASLRLRNLLGINKNFSIDTTGYTRWRTHDGVTTRMTFNHANGNLWTAGKISVGGDLDHDGTNLGLYGATPVPQPAHIVDADGTLPDITSKFNTLLAQVASLGLQAAA